MSVGYFLLVVFLIGAMALYVRSRGSGERPPGSQRSLTWYLGVAVAVWVGLMALGMAWFLLGHLFFYEDEPGLRDREGEAITWVAARDLGDAEALWRAVHHDIRAETSRSEFVGCVGGTADRTAPDPEGGEFEPGILDMAMEQAEVPSDNVLVLEGTTYSIAGRRDDTGIVAVEVIVERGEETSSTTVLFTDSFEDPHWPDPRYAPDGLTDGGGPGSVVGFEPEDPCLVGSAAVRERLQTTGTVFVSHEDGSESPELSGYRVLALVSEGAAEDLRPLGGAFWWGDDGDGVHPLNEAGVDTAGELPHDDEEPRDPHDWVTQAFLPAETMRIQPGSYTIEVWANPDALTPSADRGVPAEANERNCTIQVDVLAGTHLDVVIDDIPADGGECPHDTNTRPLGF